MSSLVASTLLTTSFSTIRSLYTIFSTVSTLTSGGGLGFSEHGFCIFWHLCSWWKLSLLSLSFLTWIATITAMKISTKNCGVKWEPMLCLRKNWYVRVEMLMTIDFYAWNKVHTTRKREDDDGRQTRVGSIKLSVCERVLLVGFLWRCVAIYDIFYTWVKRAAWDFRK